MANNKSEYTTLPTPYLLDLNKVDSHIDTQLQSWNNINAPYIGHLLSPLWTDEKDYKAVYDNGGNEYREQNGFITKNDKPLFTVSPRHFTKRQNNKYLDYFAFDIDSAGKVHELKFNQATNTFTFGNATVTIGERASIIAKRVRCFADDAIAVVLYTKNNETFIVYMKETGFVYNGDFTWIQDYGNTPINGTRYVSELSPFIQICQIGEKYGVSIINRYGYVLDSVRTYFNSFVDESDNLYWYSNSTLKPATQTVQREVETSHAAYFYATTSTTQNQINGNVISLDGVHFYDYVNAGVKGEERKFPPSYIPQQTSNTVEIDGETYRVYAYVGKEYNFLTSNSVREGEQNTSWGYSVEFDTGDEYESEINTDNYKTVNVTYLVYGNLVVPKINGIKVVWSQYSEDEHSIPASYWNSSSFYLTATTKSLQNVTAIISPNFFLDDGTMVALWRMKQNTNAWNNGYGVGQYIVMGGRMIGFNAGVYTYSTTSYYQVTSQGNFCRSNCFAIGQNTFYSFSKFCNNAAQVPSETNAGKVDPGTATYVEIMYSPETGIRYSPGSIRASSASRVTFWNYYTKSQNADAETGYGTEDAMCWTTGGLRSRLNGNWNILFNVLTSGSAIAQGLSYATEGAMGTLVTQWSQLSENNYIHSNDDMLIYRDFSGNWYEIRIEEGVELSTLFNNRYIKINTTSYWNMYDSYTGKKMHYASDYNRRTYHGQNAFHNFDASIPYIRSVASALNAAYNVQPRTAVVGLILARSTMYRVLVSETAISYDCVSPEDEDTQPIDIYYSNLGATTTTSLTCNYIYSNYTYQNTNRVTRFGLVGTTYVVSNTSQGVSPNIFTEYVMGQGNNSMAIEDNISYLLKYNLMNEPLFLYSANAASSITQTSTANNGGSSSKDSSSQKQATAFFVLQGQFYGVIDEKIYSLVYTDGVITEQDAIVDIKGMQFIGNNPMIAFFWSPSLRVIYSWTGDANLAPIYDANRFTQLYLQSHESYYDDSTQSIFIPTDQGLLVFGPRNQYIIPEWKDVRDVTVSNDGITHIVNGDRTINISYYEREGYKELPLKLESVFYGPGDNKIASFDRISIRLYNEDKDESYLNLKTATLTDKGTESETAKFSIKPSNWDDLTHTALINYSPKLIQGTGVKFYIETDASIESVTVSYQGRVLSTLATPVERAGIRRIN